MQNAEKPRQPSPSLIGIERVPSAARQLLPRARRRKIFPRLRGADKGSKLVRVRVSGRSPESSQKWSRVKGAEGNRMRRSGVGATLALWPHLASCPEQTWGSE